MAAARAAMTTVVAALAMIVGLWATTAALGSASPEKQVLGSPMLRAQHAISLPGSRILLIVEFPEDEEVNAGLAELRSNGSLEASFGERGVVKGLEGFGGASSEWSDEVAVDSQGRILLARTFDGDSWVTRLLPDGQIDRSFGTNGSAAANVRGIHSLTVEPNGDILTGGTACNGGTKCELPAVARLHEDGTLDPNFGEAGQSVLHVPFRVEEPSVADLALAPHGKILVATGETLSLEIRRLLPSGQLDRTFGNHGEAVVRALGPHVNNLEVEAVPKIEVMRDGRFVVVGGIEHRHPGRQATQDMIALRFLADGRPDLSFGHRGHVILGFGTGAAATSFVLRPRGGVVLAGNGFSNDKPYFALASLHPSGRLDQRFGRQGLARAEFGNFSRDTSLILQRGKALAIGYTEGRTFMRLATVKIPLKR